MYYIAEDQNYIVANLAPDRRIRCERIMAGITTLMKYLKTTRNP